MMALIEPHFMAAYKASNAACDIIDILPESDLIDELKNILCIQNDLFVHIFEGKHYGSNNLNTFVSYVEEVKREIDRIKETN